MTSTGMRLLSRGAGLISVAAAASSQRAMTTEALTVRPLIVCGPSGAGKSTMISRLMDDHPGVFGFSVSHTTRAPRPGEEEGVAYYFTDKDTMRESVGNGEFLEHAEVHGNLYGTSRAAVEKVSAAGKICILDIDIQGVATCQAIGLPVGAYVFMRPPSLDILRERLEKRGTETPEAIARRMDTARKELAEAETGDVRFDATIVNDDLDTAYSQLQEVVSPLLLQREHVLSPSGASVGSAAGAGSAASAAGASP